MLYVENNANTYEAIEVTLGETYGDLVQVKTGLFEGDVVVTQRAPQLYAQSLKGESKDTHTDEEPTPTKTPEPTVNQSSTPWWILVPTGAILAGGVFWAGSVYGNRRQKKVVIQGLNLDSQTIEPLKSDEKAGSLESSEKS